MKGITLFSFTILALLFIVWQWDTGNRYFDPKANQLEKIKGVCWDGRDSVEPKHMQTLHPYSVNWISLTPFGYQSNYNSPEIIMSRGRSNLRQRDQRIRHTTFAAKEAGLKVMLKPHIWLRNRDGKWRSDIEMDSEADWKAWFGQYERFILHYAALAESNQIEALCIGTELYICTAQHEKRWRDLIKKIRAIYSGALTYAANFYQEYQAIQFWDALDFIGVQAYFPLVEALDPDLPSLQAGWRPHFKALKEHHQKWQKPIVFTEFGYRSSKDAGIRPWEWEPRGGTIDSTLISASTQARCYEALFKTFWDEDWILGTFLWKWTPENYAKDQIIHWRRRSPSPFSFSPKEEGLQVLEQWYDK